MEWTSTPVTRSVGGHRRHILSGEEFLPVPYLKALALILLDPSQSLKSLWASSEIHPVSLLLLNAFQSWSHRKATLVFQWDSGSDPAHAASPLEDAVDSVAVVDMTFENEHRRSPRPMLEQWSPSPLPTSRPLGPGHLEEKQVVWVTTLCFHPL